MKYPFGLRALSSGLGICRECTSKAIREISPTCDLEKVDFLEIYIQAQEYLAFEQLAADWHQVLIVAAKRYFKKSKSGS